MKSFFFKENHTLLLSVIIIISISIFITYQEASAGSVTITHPYMTGTVGQWDSNTIWAEEFPNIGTQSHITGVGLNVTAGGANIRVKIYQDDGVIILLKNATHAYMTSSLAGVNGGLWLEEFHGLPPGKQIYFVQLNTTTATPLTGVIVKIYQDDGAACGAGFTCPGTELGESVSIEPQPGVVDYPVTATIPASGNVWAGFETSSALNSFSRTTLTASQQQTRFVGHVYGVGPNPFVGGANSTYGPWLAIRYNQVNATGNPGTLLGQSGSFASVAGVHTYPVTANTTTANVWAAFEVDNNGLFLSKKSVSGGDNTIVRSAHTFGTGPNPFVASVTNGTSAAWLSLTYNSGPELTLNSTSGPLGTNVLVNGSFFGNVTTSNIYFDGILQTTVAHTNQNFSKAISIPVSGTIVGVHTINGTDTTGTPPFTATTPFTVTAPTLTLNVTNGNVGKIISAIGKGFMHNANTLFTYSGSVLSTTPAFVLTNSTGGFNGTSFTIPQSVAGLHTVKVEDSYANNGTATYNVTSSQTIFPTSGSVGDTVTISGNGFLGSHALTFKYDGTTINTGVTNVVGSFTGHTITVPSSSPGSHTISTTDGSHTASSTFTISGSTANLSISPTHGTVGTTINLSGNGFAATSHVIFYFNNVLIASSPAFVITNATGSFSGVTITAPNISPGVYPVKALDASLNQVIGTFTISEIAVTDLHSISITSTNASLAWTAPSLNGEILSGYQINYTTPFGSPLTILTNNTHSSGTSFTVLGLTPNTQYSFRVGVWTNTGNHANGNVLDLTTNGAFVPGNFSAGNVNFNQTNPIKVPIRFERVDAGNNTQLIVTYLSTFNLACDFSYEFANLNKTYSNLSNVPADTGFVKTTFQFNNSTNDVIDVLCTDKITGINGKYIITQTNFPIVQQVKDFRGGKFGTAGQFGAIDLITLLVIIIAMIGLNRVNEAAGIIFSIITLGALAYFHIIQWPTLVVAALAIVVLIAVTTHRKIPGI